MSKTNKIFIIDFSLIPILILLATTGIGIHMSGENGDHGAWHTWAVCHVICSMAFLILICFHIRQHIGWFKTLFKGNLKGRGVTVILSIIMIAETISGIVLIVFVNGEGSSWGHFHWLTGIILTIICIGHFIKRFNRLKIRG